MKILTNSLKDNRDLLLVTVVKAMNDRNPIVDRIMDDESVEGVIMANGEGTPLITSMNSITAAHYAGKLLRLGIQTSYSIKDMDPFDEVLVFRLHTKKNELLVAPHPEFSIIVIQRARQKSNKEKNKK